MAPTLIIFKDGIKETFLKYFKKKPLLLPKKLFNRDENTVIENLDFEIKAGDRLAIIGNNGSGKTTLVNTILRFLEPANGNITYPRYKTNDNFSKVIGYQMQIPEFAKEDSVEYLLINTVYLNWTRPSDMSFKQWKKEVVIPHVKEMAEEFEMTESLSKSSFKISGGQKQKLNLMMSIIKKPEVLILDEFTTGLDMTFKSRMIKYIDIFVKENNITLIIVSHIEEEIKGLADRVALVHKGQIVDNKSIAEINSKYKSLSNYLDKYFTDREFDKNFKSTIDEEVYENSPKYSKRSFKLTSPFKSNVTISDDQERVNIIHAFRKSLLINSFKAPGIWIFLIYFVFTFFLTITKGSFDSASGIENALAIFGSMSITMGVSVLIGTWGYLLFKTKLTSQLKYIDTSFSSINQFITYALLISLVFFFLPVIIFMILLVTFIPTYYDSSLSVLSGVNWGIYVYDLLVSYALFTAIALLIVRFSKSQSIFWLGFGSVLVALFMFGGSSMPIAWYVDLGHDTGLDFIPALGGISNALLFTNPTMMASTAFAEGAGLYSIDYGGWQFILQNVLGISTTVLATYYAYNNLTKWTE
ncbi:MAG: ABC transporter ATP-binding protein [Mycoplasmataceae bacterium]|nr:ABC transporter ATP-binding protein [Mycoplasmataceae bacterium]